MNAMSTSTFMDTTYLLRASKLKVGAKKQYFYRFGGDEVEGSGSMHSQLGGKGAALAEMTRLGIPVPPGIYYQHGRLPYFSTGWTDTTLVCRRNVSGTPLA